MSSHRRTPDIDATAPQDARRNLVVVAAVFGVVLAVYAVTLLALYPALPVIARQAESIPGYATHYPPFRVDEYNYNTIAREILDGTVYSDDSLARGYTIGFPVVALPFVALFGDIGGYVANVLIVWACLIVFYLILRLSTSRIKSLVLTVLLAFVTLNWFYAVSCYTEPFAQLLLLGAVYAALLCRRRSGGGWYGVAAGALAALNLFVRPHYILLLAPLAAFLLLERRKGRFRIDRRGYYFAAGAAAVIAVWMVRNVLVFGGPFTFEYSRLVNSFVPGASSSYMKGNIFLGIHRLLFDQYHGLFTITPILLIFPAGLRRMWQEGRQAEVLLYAVSVTVMALFAASSAYPFTEFGLGSRHLVPVIPLMLLPAASFLDRTVFARGIVTVLAVYSFYQAGFGWFTGGEPGRGFFLGILNEAQSRAIILARKGELPKRDFSSERELVTTFTDALEDADMWTLLQTLHPLVIEKIEGNERAFMLYLRSRPDPTEYILSADPAQGIIIKSFSVSGQ